MMCGDVFYITTECVLENTEWFKALNKLKVSNDQKFWIV